MEEPTSTPRSRRGSIEITTMIASSVPAALIEQYVRCGKPGCHCAHGNKHGPYHYLFYRLDGRLRKRYVAKADVVKIGALCNSRREGRREIVEAIKARQRWLRRSKDKSGESDHLLRMLRIVRAI